MRLIDADALKEYMGCADAVKHGNKTEEQLHNSYSTIMMYEVADYIDDMPTIEADPVRHGRWVNPHMNKYGHPCHHCSECDFLASQKDRNFCPHCGARMDGGADE